MRAVLLRAAVPASSLRPLAASLLPPSLVFSPSPALLSKIPFVKPHIAASFISFFGKKKKQEEVDPNQNRSQANENQKSNPTAFDPEIQKKKKEQKEKAKHQQQKPQEKQEQDQTSSPFPSTASKALVNPEEPPQEKQIQRDKPLDFVSRGRGLHTSHKKMLPIAKQVQGLNYYEAIGQLTFSPKKSARLLRDLVLTARRSAEHNWNADPSSLVIHEVRVGKGTYLPRIRRHGKGMAGRMFRYRTNVEVILREYQKPQGCIRLGKFGKTDRKIRRRIFI